MKYAGFVSYSHSDREFAQWFQARLEKFPVPRALQSQGDIKPIFRDESDLSAASSLDNILTEQLEASDFLLVICSPRAAVSEWVSREIEYFLSLGRKRHILCVLLDAKPGQEAASIPPPLRAQNPLLADAREYAGDRHRAVQMIVAAMLEVDLDDLVRRRESQRRRRTASLVGAVSSLIILGSSLTTYAFLQRAELEAEKERRILAQQTAAETDEFVTSLFTLSAGDQDVPITTSELLERGLSRVRESMVETDYQDHMLGRIGQIYLQLGWYDRARAVLEDSLSVLEQSSTNPEERERIANYRLQLAHIDLKQGFPRKAEAGYLAVLELISGSDSNLTLEAQVGLAHVAYGLSDLETARQRFNTGLQNLSADADSEFKWRSRIHLALGSVDHLEGEFAAAAANFDESIHRAKGDRAILASAYANHAELLDDLGKFEQALEMYETSLGYSRAHYGPGHPAIGKTLLEMSTSIQVVRGWPAALENADAAVEHLVASVGETHPDTARALDASALKYMQVGQFDRAYDIAIRARRAYRELYADDHREIARVENNLGGILLQSDKVQEAESHFRESLRMRTALFKDEHSAPVANSRANLADTLNRLGRYLEAQSLAELSVISYEANYGPEHWRVAVSKSILGESLLGQGMIDQAGELIRSGVAKLKVARPDTTYERDAQRRLERLERKEADRDQ